MNLLNFIKNKLKKITINFFNRFGFNISRLSSIDKKLIILDNFDSIKTKTDLSKPAQSATAVVDQLEIFIPLEGLIDINKELDFHNNHKRIATLLGVNPPSRFGELVIEDNQVTEFIEKAQTSGTQGFINGGFYILNKEIFNFEKSEKNRSIPYDQISQQEEEINLEYKVIKIN